MPEPVYHLHTGEIVAWAYLPAEFEERDRTGEMATPARPLPRRRPLPNAGDLKAAK